MKPKIQYPGLIQAIYYHGLPYIGAMIKAKKIKIPHCGCMDGDKILLVESFDSFDSESVIKQMCMFHIEIEAGKLISFL